MSCFTLAVTGVEVRTSEGITFASIQDPEHNRLFHPGLDILRYN